MKRSEKILVLMANVLSPSLTLSMLGQGFFLQFREGVLGPFRLGKLAWLTPKLGNLL